MWVVLGVEVTTGLTLTVRADLRLVLGATTDVVGRLALILITGVAGLTMVTVALGAAGLAMVTVALGAGTDALIANTGAAGLVTTTMALGAEALTQRLVVEMVTLGVEETKETLLVVDLLVLIVTTLGEVLTLVVIVIRLFLLGFGATAFPRNLPLDPLAQLAGLAKDLRR